MPKKPRIVKIFKLDAVKTYDCSTCASPECGRKCESTTSALTASTMRRRRHFSQFWRVGRGCRSKEAKYCTFSRSPCYGDLLLRPVFAAPSLKRCSDFRFVSTWSLKDDFRALSAPSASLKIITILGVLGAIKIHQQQRTGQCLPPLAAGKKRGRNG